MYYDAHTSGRADFADVVLFFNQMDWIAEYEPVAMFDCNKNGRVDFRDVVRFFDRLWGEEGAPPHPCHCSR